MVHQYFTYHLQIKKKIMKFCCQLFNWVNALTTLLLKDEEQWGWDCGIPRGSYSPKGGIAWNIFVTLFNAFIISNHFKIQKKMIILHCEVLTEVNALKIIWLKDEEQ